MRTYQTCPFKPPCSRDAHHPSSIRTLDTRCAHAPDVRERPAPVEEAVVVREQVIPGRRREDVVGASYEEWAPSHHSE